MAISRRTVLRYGLGGALLLGAGGLGLSLQRTQLREPAWPLLALDERSFSILAAISERMTPHGDGLPSARSLHVAESIDGLLAAAEPGVADEVKQVLGLIENGVAGLLFDGRPRPFTQLSPEDQDRALAAWRQSSLSIRRTAYKALHGLCMAAYYAKPETYAAVGYPGPPDFGNVPRRRANP